MDGVCDIPKYNSDQLNRLTIGVTLIVQHKHGLKSNIVKGWRKHVSPASSLQRYLIISVIYISRFWNYWSLIQWNATSQSSSLSRWRINHYHFIILMQGLHLNLQIVITQQLGNQITVTYCYQRYVHAAGIVIYD